MLHAELVPARQRVIFFGSPISHEFRFTPSFSFFVDCNSEQEIERVPAVLSEGDQVMMEMGEYPFATKCCWLADRFGVSWQLSPTKS